MHEQLENGCDGMAFAARTFCPNRRVANSLAVVVPTRLIGVSSISLADIIEVGIRKVTLRYAIEKLHYRGIALSYPFSRVAGCPRCGQRGAVRVSMFRPGEVEISHGRYRGKWLAHCFTLANLGGSPDVRSIARRMLAYQGKVIGTGEPPSSGFETYATSVYGNGPGLNMYVYVPKETRRCMRLVEGDMVEVETKKITQEYASTRYKYCRKPRRNYYGFSRRVSCPRCGESGNVVLSLSADGSRRIAMVRHAGRRDHCFSFTRLDIYSQLGAAVKKMLECRVHRTDCFTNGVLSVS